MSTQERQLGSSFNMGFKPELFSFEENKPEIKDDHLTRFVVSVLMPVDMRNRTSGNDAVADFNKKTDSPLGGRFNVGNLDFIPPMILLPLGGVKTEVPFEIPAKRVRGGSPEADSAPFDPDAAKNAGGIKWITKSARQCLDTFLNVYEEKGGIDFPALVGMERDDAEKLFKIVYPAELQPIKITTRIKLGMTFTGPFLDELRHYFDYVAEERIQAAIKRFELKTQTVELLQHIKERLIIALSQAWSFANTTLNETEGCIVSNEKAGYDRPEYRFSSKQPPLDIYLLAHTNRNPMDEKQLEAAKVMSEESNKPMVELLDKIADKLTDKGGVSMSDIQTLLANRDAEWEQKFKTQQDSFAAQIAAGNTAAQDVPTTPVTPAENPSGKQSGSRNRTS